MRKPTATILFFALLFGVSSESHAFLEWLHKLSGPGPFVGAKVTGRFGCGRDGPRKCGLVEIAGGTGFVKERPRWTGTLGFGANVSYQNDLRYDGGNAPRVWIWSLEPAFEYWVREDLFVGAGYALNEFQGRRFEDFRRDAWVVRAAYRRDRPNKKRFHAWELGARYLHFEDRFRPSDFGAMGTDEEERGVVGAFFRIFFWKKSVGDS